MISVEVRGLAEVQATIRALPAASQASGEKFARKAGVVVERFWKLHLSGPASGTRLGVRTGVLRSSIHHEEVSPGVVVVGTNQKYARIHELGGKTAPHVIRPRTAKALAFFSGVFGEGTRAPRGAMTGTLVRGRLASGQIMRGEMVFARVVNHPGSKIPPRPARGPAIAAATPTIDALARGAADEAVMLASKAAGALTADRKETLATLREYGYTGRATGPVRIFKRRGE